MKSLIPITLILLLCFSLSACTTQNAATDNTEPVTAEMEETTTEEADGSEPDIPNNGEWDEILCWGDDYYLVNKYIDTFSDYKLLLGVVNGKGEWVQELTETGCFVENVIFRALGSSKILKDRSCYMYLGEGVFLASPGVTVTILDIDFRVGPWSNTVSVTPTGRREVAVWECLTWNVVDNIQKQFDATRISLFQDGWLFFCEENEYGGGMLRAMNVKGEIIDLPCSNGLMFPEYSEGLFFAEDKNYNPGFFDIDGNMVIDLSEYNLHNSSSRTLYFKGGTVTFTTYNNGGSVYKVTMDKTGRILGDPERTDYY